MAKKKSTARKRRETRFFPQSNANPIVIRVIGAVGALLLGAGAFEQFFSTRPEPWKYTPYLLGGGRALVRDVDLVRHQRRLVLRVGDAGVGVDRGDVRRIPWYAVSEIIFDPQLKAVSVKGKDESGTKFRIDAKLKSQAQAAAWIAKEAKERIPKVVELTGDGAAEIPDAHPSTDIILLDDLQVVGRKDAVTGKAIAYEPDARVCKRCERVYYKSTVPKKCACGALLTDLRQQVDVSDAEVDADADDEPEDEKGEPRASEDAPDSKDGASEEDSKTAAPDEEKAAADEEETA